MSRRSLPLPPAVRQLLAETTGTDQVTSVELVQTLWSGYGQLLRCRLDSDRHPSVIVKHVTWPTRHQHPRGWTTNRSHERKVRSYEVETAWYREHATLCGEGCRVPASLAIRAREDGLLIVLEDLDLAGFGARRSSVTDVEVEACLRWLAHFHATFMGRAPEGLWEVGTYWHLDTRPDELEVLDDGALKRGAAAIDRRLTETRFGTFVHGDAKLANFCFSPAGSKVAAVDFQYVGGGCGMKDVAYFVSSCLDEDECERRQDELLDTYFGHLRSALAERNADIDFDALHDEWRQLYAVAWTDFFRFLQGWSPGHWKIHRYSRRLAREVLAGL